MQDSKKALGLGAPGVAAGSAPDMSADVQESHHPGLEAILLPGCFSGPARTVSLVQQDTHRLDSSETVVLL